MTDNKALVTIIMATYNRADLIVESLRAIQKQTHDNFECLVIDDGGTDATETIVNSFSKSDKRIKYFERTIAYKKGLPGCRNFGLDIAKGDYIIFFDDDDIVHPQNLMLCLYYLNIEFETYFCSYIKAPFHGEFKQQFEPYEPTADYTVTTESFFEDMLTYKVPIASCTVMWRKECFETIRFDETLMYAEEWECYARILFNYSKGILLNHILYYNRKHLQSNTGQYFSGDKIKIESKKKAISQIMYYLMNKNQLSYNVSQFLFKTAIAFRDRHLIKNLLNIANVGFEERIKIMIRYYGFPYWKNLKILEKKLTSLS